jgi:streptogramin lyase
MTRNTFRILASLAAGFAALSAGMFTAGSASPLGIGQTLSPLRIERGLFQFDLYQLPAGSRPTFLLKGADGNLWFSNIGPNQIARFDVSRRQLRTFPLPHPNSNVLVMSNAPDGNVWFAGGGGPGTIGSITPAGKITEVDMPRQTGAAGLGPGPDGNLWITEGVDDKIARFDLLSRKFREFQLPHSRSGPCKITTGPDGAIWFTELGGGRIGRLTLAGQLTEFTVPTPNAQPFMIINGPDGNLWFTEYNAGNIGRITTAGEITEFPTSGGGTAPMHIVVGPDQNLWFTEAGGNALGRITTEGDLTEFSFGGAYTNPDGITVGSDNRVWFTQVAGNALGAVVWPK